MKKLAVYDFDGTLMNTPEPEFGKDKWREVKGEEYPHKGWWGRRESLDTDVFSIEPIKSIYSEFKKDVVNPNVYTIILTSRMEKLRPEVQNILDINNIKPDELILKRGNETKGDVILRFIEENPELKKIDVYDDFAGGAEKKVKEFTDIKDKLPENIEYNIYKVIDGKFSLMESTNNLLKIINEEILKL